MNFRSNIKLFEKKKLNLGQRTKRKKKNGVRSEFDLSKKKGANAMNFPKWAALL